MGDVVHFATRLTERRQVSAAAVDRLRSLLKDAEEGRILGFAYVALSRSEDAEIDAVGSTIHHPTLTRIALRDLDDKLGTLPR